MTVVATGFEASADFDGYKPDRRREVVSLNSAQQPSLQENTSVRETDTVHCASLTCRSRDAPSSTAEINQGVIDFEPDGDINISPAPGRPVPPPADKNEGTLRKLKHMQNVMKNEGFSTQSMNDNIEDFEEVPAYVRKKIALHSAK